MSAERPGRAVIPVTRIPVRARATHRSEQVTEWVLGEIVTIAERENGWVRAIGPDGYAGWVPAGPLESGGDPDAWEREATLLSVGTGTGLLERLPWGARVKPEAGDLVGLPDGRIAAPDDRERLLSAADRRRYPPEAAAVAETGREWLGVPYLWGGRTELGADCSGFLQAVFATHGMELPRDSRDQREVGRDVSEPAARSGDLYFFAPGGGDISHVALCTGHRRILHAAAGNGRVVEESLDSGGPSARVLAPSIAAITRVTALGRPG